MHRCARASSLPWIALALAANACAGSPPQSANAGDVATRLQISFTRPDGSAVERALYGWYYEESEAHSRRLEGSSHTGQTELLEDLPAGKLTVYAVERTESPRYDIATVELVPGTPLRIALIAEHPLHLISGRTVDASGEPLAGPVTATASGAMVWTRLDHELVAAHGGQTDVLGRFRFMFATPGSVRLQLLGWTAGDGSRERHYGTQPIAALEVSVGAEDREITLTAEDARTLRCEIVDDAQRPLPVQHLGLSFGPHTQWAHSGNCVDVLSNDGQAAEGAPTSVQFVWPDGADTLDVELTSPPESNTSAPRAGKLEPSAERPAACRISFKVPLAKQQQPKPPGQPQPRR